MKLPGLVKAGLFTGMMTGIGTGFTSLVNRAFNDDQVDYLSNDVTQYRKIDGIYAHTILTRGDEEFGRNYVRLERHTIDGSRTYIGYHGASYVDTIIVRTELFGSGPELKYLREKDGPSKEHFFNKANAEIEEQFRRFMPLME